MKKNLHWDLFFIVLLLKYSFKWQNMAEAGAGAGAENKVFRTFLFLKWKFKGVLLLFEKPVLFNMNSFSISILLMFQPPSSSSEERQDFSKQRMVKEEEEEEETVSFISGVGTDSESGSRIRQNLQSDGVFSTSFSAVFN